MNWQYNRQSAYVTKQQIKEHNVGALIMLGTLFGLIILIFALVLRYDPEARGSSSSRRNH
jgi:hypothetical protein